jgi:hypothetical protein
LGVGEVDALSGGDAGVAIFSVLCLVLGLVLVFDIGKFATRMLQRLRAEGDYSGDSISRRIGRFPGRSFYRRMPDWSMRAGGLWCIAVAIWAFLSS